MSRAHDRWRCAMIAKYGPGIFPFKRRTSMWAKRPSWRRWHTSSGRCLWRPGYLSRVSIERENRMLRDMRLRLEAQKFPRALRHVMLAGWCAARIVHLQTRMSIPRHLLGVSEPTALERLRDRERILGHAVEFVDGPPPDGDTHFTVGRFEDLGKPCLPYASKRVDVPPFDGSIGPA